MKNPMHFEIIGEIEEIETIGIGGRLRDIMRLQSGNMRKAELHWYEAHGIGRKKMKIKRFLDLIMARAKENHKFALCVENKDCEDLEKRKIYQILPDDDAEEEGYLRVVDESGEDYLYPQSYFVLISLSREAEEALQVAK
jgi:hypothetical protein